MGAAVNKVLLPLCGEPVIRHAVRAFCEADKIDGVVVVASADETEQMRAALCGLEKVCAIAGAARPLHPADRGLRQRCGLHARDRYR